MGEDLRTVRFGEYDDLVLLDGLLDNRFCWRFSRRFRGGMAQQKEERNQRRSQAEEEEKDDQSRGRSRKP